MRCSIIDVYTCPRPRKGWKEEVERELQVLGDGESWWQIGKNGRTLFDRPKPTVGCSAKKKKEEEEDEEEKEEEEEKKEKKEKE